MNHLHDSSAALRREAQRRSSRPLAALCAAAALAGSAVAQTGYELPAPDSVNCRGTWQYALAFLDEGFDAGRCGAIAEGLRDVESRLEVDVVGHAVRTREHYAEKARAGGIQGSRHSELMQWIVAGPNDFFVRVEPGGAFAADSRVVLARTLYDEGVKVFRADGPGIARDAYSFVVDHAGEAKASDCPIHDEWRVHAGIVNYCVAVGAAQGNGVFRVERAQLTATPPFGLHFDPQTRSYLCRVERAEGGAMSTVTAFDELGHACREWRSTWYDGRPTMLTTKTFVPFTGELLNTREFRQLAFSPSVELPDFAHMASVPDDREAARDLRGRQAYVFDPRRGLPAAPKSEAELLAARIEQLRGDRANGVQNKFVDNLNKWEASQGAVTPEVRELSAPEAEVNHPVEVRNEAVLAVSRTRSSGMPVLPRTAAAFPWGIVLVGATALGALVTGLLRRRRRVVLASTILMAAVALASASCGTGPGSTTRDLSRVDLDVFPPSLTVAADRSVDERRQCTFFVSNPSSGPVELLTASSSCGCVQVSLPERHIAPFGTVRCIADYNPTTVKPVDIRLLWQRGDHRASSRLRLSPEVL